MGYRDNEYPNPLDLFPSNGIVTPIDGRLQKRMQSGDGQSIFRAQQLYQFDLESARETSLTIEFDRFLPGFKKPNRK